MLRVCRIFRQFINTGKSTSSCKTAVEVRWPSPQSSHSIASCILIQELLIEAYYLAPNSILPSISEHGKQTILIILHTLTYSTEESRQLQSSVPAYSSVNANVKQFKCNGSEVLGMFGFSCINTLVHMFRYFIQKEMFRFL